MLINLCPKCNERIEPLSAEACDACGGVVSVGSTRDVVAPLPGKSTVTWHLCPDCLAKVAAVLAPARSAEASAGA